MAEYIGHQGRDRQTRTHLVDEGGELVQHLDLLPLLDAHLLDLGVQLHVEGGQEALIDGDLRDAAGRAHGRTRGPQPGAAEDSAHEAAQAAAAGDRAGTQHGARPTAVPRARRRPPPGLKRPLLPKAAAPLTPARNEAELLLTRPEMTAAEGQALPAGVEVQLAAHGWQVEVTGCWAVRETADGAEPLGFPSLPGP